MPVFITAPRNKSNSCSLTSTYLNKTMIKVGPNFKIFETGNTTF